MRSTPLQILPACLSLEPFSHEDSSHQGLRFYSDQSQLSPGNVGTFALINLLRLTSTSFRSSLCKNGKLQPQRMRLQQLKVRRPLEHGSSSNVESAFGVNHATQCLPKNYENKRTALYKNHPDSEINPAHLRRLAASKLVIAQRMYTIFSSPCDSTAESPPPNPRAEVSFPSPDELWQYIRHTSCPSPSLPKASRQSLHRCDVEGSLCETRN